jgi:uncharacterized protein (TIGR03437 family)
VRNRRAILRSLGSREEIAEIAGLTDASVCPTLVRKGLRFRGAGAFACQPISRLLAVVAAVFLLAVPSQAYYHYVHFLTVGAPYTPVPEAFDLTKLQNGTIAFFASSDGPSTYGLNDSWGSVLSEVKQAAAAWNSVASSALRVTFGGVESYNATLTSLPSSITPGGDVIFSELPPGLLGLGTPVMSTSAKAQQGANGQFFFPISRGLVILTNNTSSQSNYGPGPSYLEEYYTTAVHEFGHALGLQHTWTGAAMSQDVIRNTSRSRPVDADDIAAISELYGNANWMNNFGSISGRVTLGTAAVNLASVVAIPALGPAVSALTNPDGTYTINGLPPGQYQLYVHPLPPDAIPSNGTGITLPVDVNGVASFPRSGYFQTVFFVSNGSPGTTDPTHATTFTVSAGQSLTNENFAVVARTSVPLYDLVTYCYLDPVTGTYTYNGSYPASQIWMTPGFVSTSQTDLRVWAQPNSGSIPSNLTAASVLGTDIGNAVVQLYSCTPQNPCDPYLVMDFPNATNAAIAGPRHLVLTFGSGASSDMYVLPDAFIVVGKQPPALTSVTPNSDGSLTIGGAGLTADSRLFFDGLDASVVTPFTATDPVNGFITVLPPDGASSQNSTLTAFEADGQNSMFLQSASPVVYPYPASGAPQITSVTPAVLTAGANADGTASEIDITTTNTNFISGQVTLGFGTSDISVRRVWVLSPTHLVADIVVANNATPGPASVNVISGFQVLPPANFTIQQATGTLPTLALPVYNAVTYAVTLHAGDYASVFGSGLALGSAGTVVTLNGAAVPVVYASSNQVNFVVPAGFASGPATLVVNNGLAVSSGSASTAPVLLQIDGPPPIVGTVANAVGIALDANTAANPGDILSVAVTNVDPSVAGAPNRVQVRISGVLMTVLGVTQTTASPAGQPASTAVLQIQVADVQSFGGSQVPLVVSVDGSPSTAVTITAR